MPTVSLLFKDRILANYQISKGDTLLIGRNKINDIVIDNLAVSAQHAKIESDGRGFLFVDLQSENGSFVGDQLTKSYWLNDGDAVTIGKHILKFSNPKKIKQQKKTSSAFIKTMQMNTKRFRELINKNKPKDEHNHNPNERKGTKQEKPVGILSYLSEKKEHINLNDNLIRIGKDPKSDVLVKSFTVGKTAAIINKLADGWYISYVGGFSRPRVNNKILKKSYKLNNLDIIAIRSTKLQFIIL
ncbi:MAG: FHA domain-containing protein [Candidatus Hodarchaeales archaeon]|jgi:pSer/pThr/pTyr-binding forkhead associated (FHA) protein